MERSFKNRRGDPHRNLPGERSHGGRVGRGEGAQDCVADQFRDLGDYGVAEGLKSVCPVLDAVSYARGGIFPATSRPMRRAVECQKSWQNLHSVWMFDASLFDLSWSIWCACSLADAPQASQEGFRCFRALHEYPCFVSSSLVFAQESEQNFRLLKAVKSSNRPPKRARDISIPQVAQGFDGALTIRMAQAPSDVSVQECGKPINASTHVGFRAPDVGDTTMDSINCLPSDNRRWIAGLDRLPRSLSSPAQGVGHSFLSVTCAANVRVCPFDKSFAPYPGSIDLAWFTIPTVGVRHNPHPVPSVRGTNGASWYAMPFRIIPERGQGSENGIQPSRKQRSDVLQDDEAWSQFANKTGDLVEQAASCACQSCAKSCEADVLAGETAADNVNGNSTGSKSFAGKLAHVAVAGHVGPVLGEDFAGVFFDFAERDGFEAIVCSPFKMGALQAEAEAADAAEKIKDAQLGHSSRPQRMPVVVHRHGSAARCVGFSNPEQRLVDRSIRVGGGQGRIMLRPSGRRQLPAHPVSRDCAQRTMPNARQERSCVEPKNAPCERTRPAPEQPLQAFRRASRFRNV